MVFCFMLYSLTLFSTYSLTSSDQLHLLCIAVFLLLSWCRDQILLLSFYISLLFFLMTKSWRMFSYSSTKFFICGTFHPMRSATEAAGYVCRCFLSDPEQLHTEPSYCRAQYRLRSIDGVITKFLQDKDSLHCIALFNVTQLYENLKTNKKQTKQRQNIINSMTPDEK